MLHSNGFNRRVNEIYITNTRAHTKKIAYERIYKPLHKVLLILACLQTLVIRYISTNFKTGFADSGVAYTLLLLSRQFYALCNIMKLKILFFI